MLDLLFPRVTRLTACNPTRAQSLVRLALFTAGGVGLHAASAVAPLVLPVACGLAGAALVQMSLNAIGKRIGRVRAVHYRDKETLLRDLRKVDRERARERILDETIGRWPAGFSQ
jgi:hypothetical protein